MSLFDDPVRARRVGHALAVLSVLATLVGLVLFITAGGRLLGSWMPQNLVGSLALAVAFWAMVRRQPHNGAVWTLGWSMVLMAFGQVLVIGLLTQGVAAALGIDAVRSGAPYALATLPDWVVWVHVADAFTWIPAVMPLVTFSLLLFPDGRLPSRRWLPVAVLAGIGIVASSVAFALAARPQPDTAVAALATPVDAGGVVAWFVVGGVAIALAVVLSVASLAVRYRRSSGLQRRQIRWIAAGGAMFALSMSVWAWAVVDVVLVERMFWYASLVTFPALMASYAVAILRYRLYGIDVVISRSLVVAVLAVFIASVYITVVVGVGHLIGAADGSRLGLQVVATGIVAVAFQPVRQRMRRFADRAVLGRRATPYEVLAGFSREAANVGDDSTLQRVADLLAAGTGARPAIVWLRVGEQLRPAAASGDGELPSPVRLTGDQDLPEIDATFAVAVRHDDELLGAVSIARAHNEAASDQDEVLAGRVASGLSLMLRNMRLTEELRLRLDEIQRSRQRIVHAQHDARRGIERQLREDAGRHLEALRKQLKEAGEHAAQAGAAKASGLLEQLAVEADEASRTLRDLGHGVYPPLLEADGLGHALADHAAKMTVPTTVHRRGIGRYARDVETAVYFSVLEALQNATKYAQASSVHVRLAEHDGELRFEVSDDGVGFAHTGWTTGTGLHGIADRLDTLGGRLTIDTAPGAGTRLHGVVPVTGRVVDDTVHATVGGLR